MQHLSALISDLALILGSAAVISIIFKFLKQPVVLGYLLAGLLVGPNFHLFPTVVETKGITAWAEIGVIFLLFGLGLEFSFKKLMRMGGVAGVTAVLEVFLTMVTGYFLGRLLGWPEMDCLFFGGILAIASTTIIIRSFEELGVKSQNFAGLVTGILVIEDLVAVILMVVLSTVAVSREFEGTEMTLSILKLAFFLVLWFVSGIYFLPSLLRASRRFLSEETLLIISIALCLGMVVLAHEAGFSPALGAFIMGSILAETSKAEKIESLIRPLKNVFGAVFFVSVGMLIDLQVIVDYYVPVLLGTLVLLCAKPAFVTAGAIITGQSLKTSIQTGMSLSQIGEFSFIIASLGLSLGVISSQLYPVAVAISVLTTFTTPFMIRFSEPFYNWVDKKMPLGWKKSLMRYSAVTQKASETTEWRKYIRKSFVNIIVFSVIIISVIVMSNKYLSMVYSDSEWNRAITTTLTLTMLSPFLWALAFRGTRFISIGNTRLTPSQRRPLVMIAILRIIMCLFFIGLVFDTFYSPLIAVLGVVCTSAALILLRNNIRSYYFRIEKRFRTNLNAREESKENDLSILAPWDSHIATIELHPALSFIGKPLHEIKLRERFGINIAMIRRGEVVINVPSRYEMLFPNDEVSFIGTDTQLTTFKEYIEAEIQSFVSPIEDHVVTLHHFTVSETSDLVGKTIRGSSIRELAKGLVVGIERKGERILNPESNVVIESNDVLWLVGDDKRIQVLARQCMES